MCTSLYTWSHSMPLLTPLRRRGSTDPMLKQANYWQCLPHSGEARSSRGQPCETFLQPAGPPPHSGSCPPSSLLLSLSLLLYVIFTFNHLSKKYPAFEVLKFDHFLSKHKKRFAMFYNIWYNYLMSYLC